jgi:hypothetical protein
MDRRAENSSITGRKFGNNSVSNSIISNNLFGSNLRASRHKFTRETLGTKTNPSDSLALPIAQKMSKSQTRQKKKPVTPSKQPIMFHQGSKS